MMPLFSGTKKRPIRSTWKLDARGISAAATIVVDLLDHGVRPCFFSTVAKRRLGLACQPPLSIEDVVQSKSVPDEWAHDFVTLQHQLFDNRDEILRQVESMSEHRLVPSVIREVSGKNVAFASRAFGGQPTNGWDIRDSPAGVQDDVQQQKMTQGSLVSLWRRRSAILPNATPSFVSAMVTKIKEIDGEDDKAQA
jgi:hypothetical protein